MKRVGPVVTRGGSVGGAIGARATTEVVVVPPRSPVSPSLAVDTVALTREPSRANDTSRGTRSRGCTISARAARHTAMILSFVPAYTSSTCSRIRWVETAREPTGGAGATADSGVWRAESQR